MAKSPLSPKDDKALFLDIWSPEIADNPLNFVLYAFPWGVKGTPLEGMKGPRGWQKEMLQERGRIIAENKVRAIHNKPPVMSRDAVSSGRGIGKSAYVAFMTLWSMSCVPGSTTIVTANTEAQLKSRTWAELGKWHTMAINSHWFERDTMSLRPAKWFEDSLKRDLKIDTGYYYAQAQLWSEDRPDAFAGAHNMNGMQLIFDEASGIPASIWEVSEGFFTEPVLHRYWSVFSNPRRNTGTFFECFHKNRNFWRTRHIDSRMVEGTDRAIYDRIIEQFGEDSDQARVEVKGMFPRQGQKQFIGIDVVQSARVREVVRDDGAPVVMGVDVARFGDDKSVIALRAGRDARSIPWQSFKGLDTVQFAGHVMAAADKYRPDIIFVDGGGVGGGVVDMLKAAKYRVSEVQFGAKADSPMDYVNKRTEMWARLKEWLAYGCIPNMDELQDDLTGPEYSYRTQDSNQLLLEPKEKMKERGLASPDWGDALALTFASGVARRDVRGVRREPRMAHGVDYRVLG